MLINGVDIITSVARHEAGHWLAWRLQGGDVEGIEFSVSQSGQPKGAAILRLERHIDDTAGTISFIKSRIITLWAGVYAQSFDGSDYNPDVMGELFLRNGGRIDHIKAHEYLLLLKNLLHNESLENIHYELDQTTAALVAENFDEIIKIGNYIASVVKEIDRVYTFNTEILLSALITHE